MPLAIEDYALIGGCGTAALVGRDGSIDWLCFPRFDSGACFAALLGEPRHGRWLIAPAGAVQHTRRRYRDDLWRRTCTAIHTQVCEAGFDAQRNTFVQSHGSTHLDASLLLIPLVGFLPCGDSRVLGTIAAIENELMVDGLVRRYSSAGNVDGLPPGEGAFLPCSFWLADNLALAGRRRRSRTSHWSIPPGSCPCRGKKRNAPGRPAIGPPPSPGRHPLQGESNER